MITAGYRNGEPLFFAQKKHAKQFAKRCDKELGAYLFHTGTRWQAKPDARAKADYFVETIGAVLVQWGTIVE